MYSYCALGPRGFQVQQFAQLLACSGLIHVVEYKYFDHLVQWYSSWHKAGPLKNVGLHFNTSHPRGPITKLQQILVELLGDALGSALWHFPHCLVL